MGSSTPWETEEAEKGRLVGAFSFLPFVELIGEWEGDFKEQWVM